jgi:hypothetical protein
MFCHCRRPLISKPFLGFGRVFLGNSKHFLGKIWNLFLEKFGTSHLLGMNRYGAPPAPPYRASRMIVSLAFRNSWHPKESIK